MDRIEMIIELEWDMFTNAKNDGGRAFCQDDKITFWVMRKSQFAVWRADVLDSYLNDLQRAADEKWNMVSEKYARMMKYTVPEEYQHLEPLLPDVSDQKKQLVDQIMGLHRRWIARLVEKYPNVMKNGRMPQASLDQKDEVSMETYLQGEFLTYSEETLRRYLQHAIEIDQNGGNLAEMTLAETARLYKLPSIEAEEQRLALHSDD